MKRLAQWIVLLSVAMTIGCGRSARVSAPASTTAAWSRSSTGLPSGSSCFALTASGDAWVAGTESGVYRSTDAGRTWTWAARNPDNLYVRALATVGTTMLVGTDGGVFRSTDQGQHWSASTTQPIGCAV